MRLPSRPREAAAGRQEHNSGAEALGDPANALVAQHVDKIHSYYIEFIHIGYKQCFTLYFLEEE